ncbi:DHH family phosphoesterase [Anaerotignum sp.]|uniref:DHH family phosphoesterase n=1 Tax=Anaerotignum sp. TaxID=2039241 RepID=UPI0028983768|nr:bifunctional oligoribonuclease/PAP phosphatase NrnA [Anaerotignum sp.]
MKGMNDSLEKIREIISAHQNIVLCGHINPDGDAIGANLALAASLKKAGKNVQVLLRPYAPKYELIPNGNLVVQREEVTRAELFIALDCGDIGRFDWIEDIFKGAKCTMNIDHHASNSFFGEYNYVQENASSTCEIVFNLLKGFFPIDEGIASALYAGIIYDTGGFRHSSTMPETMRVAGELMSYGIPFTKIYNVLFDSRSFSEMKIMGKAFDKAELYFDGKVIFTSITMGDIEECKGTNKELDAIINYIKGVNDIKIACFLYEKNEMDVKASFRGNDGYDVCALAQKFGGGGHVKAAGCTIVAPMATAKELIFAEIEKML